MSPQEREQLGIRSLPQSLRDALDAMEQDELICATLGEHIYTQFMRAKEIEWERYRAQVTQWELDQYLASF